MKSSVRLALDNAGKIYPAAMTKNWNAVFGISAYIKAKVNVTALKNAVVDLAPRFPTFYQRLEQGFSWNYLVPATDFDIVEEQKNSPCRPINLKSKAKPLFRVVYDENEIRVEVSHCITDGNGALQYLKALLVRYYELCDEPIPDTHDIKTITQEPSEAETTDDFQRVYEKGVRCSRADSKAFQLKFEVEDDYLNSTKICIPIDKLKSVSKEIYKCTITQFVSTVYALALLSKYPDSSKPVKLSIPVNLRPYFNSITLRNFSTYITVNVTPKTEITFISVLNLIKQAMEEKITKEYFIKTISQNVADEKTAISKFSPYLIKRIVMQQAFRIYGEKKFTSTVTSVGNVTLPDKLAEKINYFSVTLGETYINKINCTVLGFKNTLCVNISSPSKDMSIQNKFMDIIKSNGIPCDIDCYYN